MEGLPVHSLRTLIGDLAMVISNTVQLPNHEEYNGCNSFDETPEQGI